MLRRFPTLVAALLASVAAAAETPDWARALAPDPERGLLRLVVVEHRADDWLIAHRAEVFAALRAERVGSSVTIVAAEVLLARAELTYDDALELHARLERLHRAHDARLADLVLLQWVRWVPLDADPDVVVQRMAAHGWILARSDLISLRNGDAFERTQRLAGGGPPEPRQVLVSSGSLYGQRVALDGTLTVRH